MFIATLVICPDRAKEAVWEFPHFYCRERFPPCGFIKGLLGILALQSRRAAFLSDPTHKVVFHYTPKHSSWMNQIEIWLGILVRKLLKRSSFLSVKDLQAKILAFIDYYNRTMAKPFKWTYQGKALVA